MNINLILSDIRMKIHEKIRLVRQSKGYTQEYVADKLHIDTVNYGRIERGQTNITIDRFIKLCEILDTKAISFFKEETPGNFELVALTRKIFEEIKQINQKLDSIL